MVDRKQREEQTAAVQRKSRRELPRGGRDSDWLVGLSRLVIFLLVLGLLALHGFASKSFTVDSTTVALVVLAILVALVPVLESATLPGGGGFVFRKRLEELHEASIEFREKAAQAAVIKTEPPAPAPQQELGASHDQRSAKLARVEVPPADEDVVERVLSEAATSPRIALIRLSIALDETTNRILAASGWDPHPSSLTRGTRRLSELGQLPPSAVSAVDLFVQVRDALVHGRRDPTDEEVIRAIDAGLAIHAALLAVPRERNVVAAIDVPLFADADANAPIRDATGLLLATFGPGPRHEQSERIYPTTRNYFRVGGEVAWGWDVTRQWGEAWFRHPETGKVEYAWTASTEFIGPMLDDAVRTRSN